MSEHSDHCIICRARALDMDDNQLELVLEALSCGAAAAWRRRGILRRPPTGRQMVEILNEGMDAWSALYGAAMPESSEVINFRKRGGGDRGD